MAAQSLERGLDAWRSNENNDNDNDNDEFNKRRTNAINKL